MQVSREYYEAQHMLIKRSAIPAMSKKWSVVFMIWSSMGKYFEVF